MIKAAPKRTAFIVLYRFSINRGDRNRLHS